MANLKIVDGEEDVYFEPRITFSGAGVLHVKSSDIVKTKEAKAQIEALKSLLQKGLISSKR